MAQISIPGGQGSQHITFTVTGSAAVNLASDFNAAVQSAGTITSLSSGGGESSVAGALNIITPSATTSYSLSAGHQYTYAAVTSATQLVGSAAGGDIVLAGDTSPGATFGVAYTAQGSDNRIIFDSGDNTYTGDSVGGDTVSGGSGSDTINTGTGATTIFAGAGSTHINMNDTSGYDIAALVDGNSVVDAEGANDVVYASAAMAASTTGTIIGGSGLLNFVAGASANNLSVNVVAGSGTTHLFTNDGSNITFGNTAGTAGTAEVIAGAGNETLNGAAANGGFDYFGDTVAGDAATNQNLIIGGTGTDFFSTGVGNETIVAGQGGALFQLNDFGDATHVTIADLSSADYVNFAGLGIPAEQTLLQTSSSVSAGNLTVTLPDGTTVEFLGITTFNGHLT